MNPTGIEAAKSRGDMSRPELYAMIDELQETVRLCAERITSLSARAEAAEAALATAREALEQLLRCEYESAEPGLCDCADNTGKPYQSQHLANSIQAAESAIRSRTGVSSNG